MDSRIRDERSQDGTTAAANTGENKAHLPDWAFEPIRNFRDHTTEILDVLHLSCSGISMHRNRPDMIKWSAKVDEFLERIGEKKEHSRHDHGGTQDLLDEAERQANLAKQELEKGFPLLHAQALISCWTALEVYVENLLVAWLENDPTALEAEAVGKLKIPLWEYHQMDGRERNLHIVQLLQREQSGPLAAGVTAFEVQLRPFGLGGEVDRDISKDIFEASHLRNVLVHRRGVADRRLLNACPWMDLKLGEPVVMSQDEFARLTLAITHYAVIIHDRVRQHFGLEARAPAIVAHNPNLSPTPEDQVKSQED